MSSTFTFKWPSGPEEVIVTGTFDEWSKSLPLVKQADGSFELTVPFAADAHVLYKYVVDGEWLTNATQSIDTDSNGIENNVLTSDVLTKTNGNSQIPEAGGLEVKSDSFSTTVMPSTEGQQATMGEPGIFIPKDEKTMAAFTTFENTDRDLNEAPAPVVELSAEEKKKQKKKLKRTKYKLNKKAKAAQSTGTSSSAESSPAPEENIAVIAAATAVVEETAIPVVDEPVVETAPVETPVTEEPQAPVANEKEAAPYSLTQTELASSTVVVPAEADTETKASVEPMVEENEEKPRETLDPGVSGVFGAGEGAGALATGAEPSDGTPANMVASEISQEKTAEPSVQPAVAEPIESPESLAAPVAAGPADPASANVEEVCAVPSSTEETATSPDSGRKRESEEEIIIAQGGHDRKAIEKQIAAAEQGPVSVEELQPTASEAEQLVKDAHIPPEEIKAEQVPLKEKSVSSSNGKTSKTDKEKKKKRGLFSKLKKMFK